MSMYHLKTLSPSGNGTTGRYSRLHFVVDEFVTGFMNEVHDPTGPRSSISTCEVCFSMQFSPTADTKTQAMLRFIASDKTVESLYSSMSLRNGGDSVLCFGILNDP